MKFVAILKLALLPLNSFQPISGDPRGLCHAKARVEEVFNFLQELHGREVCVYSISCKNQNNIDITIDWLTRHARS